MKKVIYELSDEDLIALAAGADPEEIIDKISEAAKFIHAVKIKHGDTKISAALIYYTYKKWRGANPKQAKPQFFQDFSKYFPVHRVTEGRVYLLNPKPFDLSEDTYWLIRREMRAAKAKKNKKSSG